MKTFLASLLQVVIVLIGIGVLALMLWEPHLEGRNVNATTFEIYFKDPFLAYVYVGSTPFFIALGRAFGLFGHFRKTGAFSQQSVDALRAIKRCGLALRGFVMGGAVIIAMSGEGEPAGAFLSLVALMGSSAIAGVAALAARNLQNSLKRSEVSRA
jgi:hypothetical protein